MKRPPKVLASFFTGLPDTWLYAHEGGNTWSSFGILAHLIHGEKTDWIPRMRLILEGGPLKTFDPFDRVGHFEESKGKNIMQLLAEFKQLRAENLMILRQQELIDSDYEKMGIHPDLGAVTLRELLSTWVVHDLSHIKQVSRVLAKQYKGEVGPWSAYLPVLSE